MKTEEILKMLPGHLVEYKTFTYNNSTYHIPYETIEINGEIIPGLRKNTDRAKIFEGILEDNDIKISSHLDTGSNLGFFVNHFSNYTEKSRGVEMEDFYINMCGILYPDLPNSFIKNDLNKIKLRDLNLGDFDLVTSLSMIEYINDKESFVQDLFNHTRLICIVEGHSEDIRKGLDEKYEKILKSQSWDVTRCPFLTEAGTNAPPASKGRPLWICKK